MPSASLVDRFLLTLAEDPPLRRRQRELHGAEEDGYADPAKADAAVERIPPSRLAAGLKNIGDLERHDADDGIVLPVARVADRDGDDARPPVSHKLLGTGVEDWLGRDHLGTSLVHQVVVDQDRALPTLLLLDSSGLGPGGLVLLALAPPVRALDVGELQSNNLVDNDAENTRWPERVGWSVDYGVLLLCPNGALFILELRPVGQLLGKFNVLPVSAKSLSELRLAKEADLPVKLAGHAAVGLDTTELGDSREHLPRVLDELLNAQLHLAHDVIGRQSIAIPELHRQLLVGLDEIAGDQKATGFLENGVEVVLDDTGAELGLGELAPADSNVRVGSAPFAAPLVLLAEASCLVDSDEHDAQGHCLFLHIVALQHLAHVDGQALWRDVHGCGCPNSPVDKVGY
ncbi:hypothetical protein TPAR_06890 [Tolypocladium paradoxum]|uniref:Uncharacterized protein n=1 Tax=Tolypocladium paradoxum TaxID=94208 RepID=A0A2S4KRY0_9HYPO|nr:hypothetical protein TPAR_06890 [Tolypocladium paradoxum]